MTYNILTPFLNQTQGTHCFPHEHIDVSLLGYLVPHHHLLIQLLHLLHVHLKLCSRVLLWGKRKKKIDTKIWVHIFSITTTDKQKVPFTNMLSQKLLRVALCMVFLRSFTIVTSYKSVSTTLFLDTKMNQNYEKTTFSIYMSLIHHIFISVRDLTSKLNPSAL